MMIPEIRIKIKMAETQKGRQGAIYPIGLEDRELIQYQIRIMDLEHLEAMAACFRVKMVVS